MLFTGKGYILVSVFIEVVVHILRKGHYSKLMLFEMTPLPVLNLMMYLACGVGMKSTIMDVLSIF